MRYLLLTSAFMLLSYNYSAASNNDFGVNLGTHTHLPQLELNSPPLNPNGAYKTARVCALGSDTDECGLNIGFSTNNRDLSDGAKKCKNNGYTITSCSAPQVPTEKCPYHAAYFKACACPSSWKSCLIPEYGTGTACAVAGINKYASCQRDDAKACKEQNPAFVPSSSCAAGWQLDDANKCSYNSTYGICCNKCSGYDYTSIEQGYLSDGSCSSCWGTKYKRKVNPCSGYSTCECGKADNASTCYSGSTPKYSSCKSCCDITKYPYNSSNCAYPTGSSCNGNYTACCTTQRQKYDICDSSGSHDYSIARYKYCDGTYSDTFYDFDCPNKPAYCDCYQYWY